MNTKHKRIFRAIATLLFLTATGYFVYNNYYKWGFQGKVCLLPLGKNKPEEVAFIKKEIEDFYHFEVTILPTQALPKEAYYKPRNRYNASEILSYLSDVRPESQDKIIALTQNDISIKIEDNKDWGIMGLGYLGGACCVASTFRLKGGNPSKEKFRERFSKVVLHEVGHTLGLRHCSESKTCFMSDADGTIKTVDREKKQLCAKCLDKISYVKL